LTINNTTIANSIDVAANARASSNPFVDEFQARDPTTADIQYPIQKKWLNTTTNAWWELKNFLSFSGITTANWVLIGNQGSATETLTTDDGMVVPPTGNNINVFGDGVAITTTGNPGTSTVTINATGAVATQYDEDVGSAVPSGGILNVLGANGITTTGSGNTITIELTGGSQAIDSIGVDAFTAPGTNPVLPDSNGLITVTGAQVAAGTTTNVIRTDSLSANHYTIEVQRSQAVASTTIGDNGVSHFNSADFTVDANGFVALKNQAAFLAYNTINQNAVTGDNTIYTITFNSVEFDETSSFAGNTFTAPVSGVYFLGATVVLTGISPAHISGGINIRTTPMVITPQTSNYANAVDGAGDLTVNAGTLVFLNAGNTATLEVQVGGGAKTVNVIGTINKTTFFGYKIQN